MKKCFFSRHWFPVVFVCFISRTCSASVALDAGFTAQTDSPVTCISIQGDGMVLAGGGFSSVSGVPRGRVARLNASGALDMSFDPGANDEVSSIVALPDGRILLGGLFASVAGVARSRLACLNIDGSINDGFANTAFINGSGTTTVTAIVPQSDGRFIVGGLFTQAGGTPRSHLARLNSDGRLDMSFNPGANNMVYGAAALSSGKVLVWGAFTQIGGLPRNYLALVNADGSVDAAFNPAPNDQVTCAVELPDGKILVAGNFSSIGGVVRGQMARLMSDGSVDPAYSPSITGQTLGMVPQADGRLIIAGWFGSAAGLSRPFLARLNGDGTPDASFNASPDGAVFAVASQADGKVVIGGPFSSVGGGLRTCLARLSNDVATQSVIIPTASRVEWQRSGSTPETLAATFELSTDAGASYSPLGGGTRIAGGWELTGLSLPVTGQIRALARTRGGYFNGSGSLIEQIATFDRSGGSGGTEYQKIAETIDAAGRHGMSANYTSDSSVDDVVGVSSVVTPAETANHGYIGQLYEVTGIQLSASPASVHEGASRQLRGSQLLDDASLLMIPESSITWSIQSGSLVSITPDGVATAGIVYEDTGAVVAGGYGDFNATLSLTVLNVNTDDLPGYTGDGLDDAWQVQFFGLNNPLANPLQDPDADGHDNLFEFTAALIPTDAGSRFSFRIEDVPGFPLQKRVVFNPRFGSRNYSILTSTTLAAGSWSQLSVGVVSDNGDERTVTDLNAAGDRKFYKVQIVKP